MDISKIQSQDWNCIICSDLMDGDKNGLVAVSKRCSHIFHETCIKRWINDGAHTCPVCKLENFHIEEVILNPEFPKQYHKWEQDPGHYSYEQAFNEEYPHSDSKSNSSHNDLKYESVLLPNELRGLGRREKLTQPEAFAYMKETKNKLKENINGKRYDVERLALNAFQAQDVALDNLKEGFNGIHRHLDHLQVIDTYEKKVDHLQEKIKTKISKIKNYRNINYEKIDSLLCLSQEIGKYRERFRMAGKGIYFSSDAPLKQSQDCLKQVDLELDALVESQPQSVKDILIDPPQLNDAPVLDLNPQQGRTRGIIKVALFAFTLFTLYRVARSQAVSNFFHKHWKHDLKRS